VNPSVRHTASLILLSCDLALSSPVMAQSNACAGKVGEAAASCQREQAAVRQEERRGELQSGIDYRDNALARCDPLSGNDKEDCVRRVQGEGMASGSVEGGGIIRETRTITIGPTPAAGGSGDTGTSTSTGTSTGNGSTSGSDVNRGGLSR
jgi:hypothetical protein